MSGAEDMPLCEAFIAIVELADKLGAHSLNRLPGCWEHKVDDAWWLAVNGHDAERTAESPEGMSHGAPMKVPPHTAYIEYNGWAWGLIAPWGGEAGFGSAANEDTFIAAVKAATARVPA